MAVTAMSAGSHANAQVTVGGIITERYGVNPAVTTLDSYSATSPGMIQRGITANLPSGPFNSTGRRGVAISAGGQGFVSASSYAECNNTVANSAPGRFNLTAVANSQSIWNDFVVSGPAGGPAMVPFSARIYIAGNASLNASAVSNPMSGSWGLSAQANYGLVINDLVGINGSNFIVSITDGGPPDYQSDGIFTNFSGALHTTSVSVMVPVNTPFSMRMFLQTRAVVDIPLQSTGLLTSNIDFGHTASFESGGTLAPFIVPDGYTVNSVSAGVVNNTYTIPAPGATGLLGMAGVMAGRRRRRTATVVAVAAITGATSAASAQWTVVNLHPAGTQDSVANAADGALQAGTVSMNNAPRAALWSGTAASWMNFNPAGSLYSGINAASGGQQAGYAYLNGVQRASVWSGTSASWVDLNPAGSTFSVASAVSGGRQAGYAEVGGVSRASLWSGNSASWVDLHPAGASLSAANAMSGGQQAGYAVVNGANRASVWSGTSASWINLNPVGSEDSIAWAISGGQQAGQALVGDAFRASLWSGTAASWIDLHPAGASESNVLGMSTGMQVGYVDFSAFGGRQRASLWTGTAASLVDLSSFLPNGIYTSSLATGISTDGMNTYITGFGFSALTGRNEALLWTQPIPAPGAVTLLGLGGLIAARRRR